MLNLGSPDSASVPDVRRYLREFLMDGRVLDAPFPVRWFVVHALILPRRPKASAESYAGIWTEEGSPLIVISERQRKALAERVGLPVALGMRYGNPSTPSAVDELLAQGVDDLFIAPMYPHYAMSSYETAVVRAMEAIRERAPELKTTLLPPFYNEPGYIDAMAENARPALEDGDFDQLIFSFHGIPQRHLVKSDPSHAHCLTTPDCCNTCHPAHATCYRHQCAMTVEKMVERLDLPRDKYRMTFQSRLGRDPWLQPYTDKTLEALPGEGVKKLKILCPAFTADCLETLEEIETEGRGIFMAAGGESYEMIPCLNDHPKFIDFLENRIAAWRDGAFETARATGPPVIGT